MLLHEEVLSFLRAALECSIYINPTDPGLTAAELAKAARRADFLEGEINDAIPQVATQYFGGRARKLQLEGAYISVLMAFHGREEPDYRNPAAFHSVFEVMRRLIREKGIGKALIERPDLTERATGEGISEHDVQIAITIIIANGVLSEEDGVIRFARGKESWGSPGDPGNMRAFGHDKFPKTMRARAYPIVKTLIAERDDPNLPSQMRRPDTAKENEGDVHSNDEWLSARASLDLLGAPFSEGIRAICKRAHAKIVTARAKRYVKGTDVLSDVEVPAQFWWAEGEEALKQDWNIGDFDTWIDKRVHLKAFGVQFRRSEIEEIAVPAERKPVIMNKKVFIGHGRSNAWRTLKDFLSERLNLAVVEYDMVPTAGFPTVDRLKEMLDAAQFAFILMTAEDQQQDGTVRARENVIHEAGLFQGRLGFHKAIILLEEGCEEFSNIHGLGQIRFEKNKIRAQFEEVRRVLEREGLIANA